MRNNVQKIRERMLMSKAELARRSGLSALTIDRIENGKVCRMDTMRKIILALGLTLEDKDQVFGPVELDEAEFLKNRKPALDEASEESERATR